MVSTLHTRRAVFGAMALAPVVAAMPVMAATKPKISASFAAEHELYNAGRIRFNSLPENLEYENPSAFAVADQALSDGYDRFHAVEPQNWAEFAIYINEMNDHSAFAREMVAHVKRLAGAA